MVFNNTVCYKCKLKNENIKQPEGSYLTVGAVGYLMLLKRGKSYIGINSFKVIRKKLFSE